MTALLNRIFGFYEPTEFGTTFLSAEPNFWAGFARVLDIGGTWDFYNDSPTPAEADYKALFADWYIVGRDIEKAAGAQFSETLPPIG